MVKIRVVLVAFLAVSLLGMMDCDSNGTNSEEHPLVGTWVLSNLTQTSTFIAAESYGAFGISPGDTLGGGTVGWQQFQAMGVEGTIVLKEDESFSLSGSLPVASDTLGNPPDVVPLTDQGNWNASESLDTFSLNGSLYQLQGDLSLDDEENPTEISVSYTQVTEDETMVMQTEQGNFAIMVDIHSSSTLSFERQE